MYQPAGTQIAAGLLLFLLNFELTLREISEYIYIYIYIYIVTCQPIVGLRNRGYATRSQAPAGKQDFRTDAMTSHNRIAIRFLRNMPR
jgi:hypothetical protein